MADDLLFIRQIGHILMSVIPDPFVELLRLHPFDPILTCRVDIGQDENVRIIKRGQKIMKQRLGSGIPVGLEDDDDSSLPTRSESVV